MRTPGGTPGSAFDVLFPGAEGPPPIALTVSDRDLDPGNSFSAAARKAVVAAARSDLDETVASVADVSLEDVVFAGWRAHSALRAAGRRTARAPGRREIVELAAHRIEHSAHPTVAVELDGVTVLEVPLTLNIVVLLRGCCLRVAYGTAWEVVAGRAEVTVSLTAGKAPPFRRTAAFELPGAVRLGDGLVLVAEGRPDAAGQARTIDLTAVEAAQAVGAAQAVEVIRAVEVRQPEGGPPEEGAGGHAGGGSARRET